MNSKTKNQTRVLVIKYYEEIWLISFQWKDSWFCSNAKILGFGGNFGTIHAMPC